MPRCPEPKASLGRSRRGALPEPGNECIDVVRVPRFVTVGFELDKRLTYHRGHEALHHADQTFVARGVPFEFVDDKDDSRISGISGEGLETLFGERLNIRRLIFSLVRHET